jgi:hypothetical protein
MSPVRQAAELVQLPDAKILDMTESSNFETSLYSYQTAGSRHQKNYVISLVGRRAPKIDHRTSEEFKQKVSVNKK